MRVLLLVLVLGIGMILSNSDHLHASPASQTATQTLIIGIPIDMPLPQTARDVIVGNPELLDSVITSGRMLVLTGKMPGATSVTIHDAAGELLLQLPVRIEANLDDLNSIIATDLGFQTVTIRALKRAIIIGGTVSSTSDADRIEEVVRAYFGIPSTSDGQAGALRLVNTIKIAEREQVMLRVVVSEVQRSMLKQLGVDTQGSWSIGDITFANTTTFATSHAPTGTFAPGVKTTNGSSTATLKALERAGYLKTLAEPTLTAISGESAKFTAGGEIPVPTGDICSTNAAGLQSCQTSYGYKPIGVTLSFTPVVLSAGRINLRINTEVTEIDPDNGSRSNTGNIPAFRSRKMETTVELASGAALMSAGLIQHQSSATYDRVPGMSSVPVLGQLFQSNDYQNHQTELLISVVPYIAKPFGAMEPNSSEQEFLSSSDRHAKLVAELNSLYGLHARPSAAKFGFEIP